LASQRITQRKHQPLYYLVLKAWLALGWGSGETAVRLLSALLSTAAIAAVYLLGREMFAGPSYIIFLAQGLIRTLRRSPVPILFGLLAASPL